jgi:hypothetical protein
MCLLFRTSILATAALVGTSITAAANCTLPPILKHNQQNVDSEEIHFNYRSDSFSADIYSGFMQQATANGTTFCIRYEVENTAAKPIELFYWPLASGLEVEKLGPGKRTSIASISPPSYPPAIGGTFVYAFLSEVTKTFAYQAPKLYPFLIHRAPQRNFGANDLPTLVESSGNRPIEVAQITYDLKDARKFPAIGAEFSNKEQEITAESSAEWDGKTYLINFAIKSRGKTKDLQAPLALAMLKGGSPSNVLALYRQFKKETSFLPLNDGSFVDTFRSSPMLNALYVVQQPITFSGPDGRACFLAATYSPIPIPDDLASCSLPNM